MASCLHVRRADGRVRISRRRVRRRARHLSWLAPWRPHRCRASPDLASEPVAPFAVSPGLEQAPLETVLAEVSRACTSHRKVRRGARPPSWLAPWRWNFDLCLDDRQDFWLQRMGLYLER